MFETSRNYWQHQSLSTKLMFGVNLGMLILFLIGMGYFVYQQFNRDTELLHAYPTSLNRPNRFLSFQGRVTDSALNPVTGATNMQFKLFDSGPGTGGGTELWDSGTCSITPDQDGIINVSLGNDCGSEVSAAVFSENQNVWLEITVGAETLSPRQLIHSVGYALNSETLQGYPASASAVENTVLIMDNSGNVVLGSASPTLQSTGDSFTIEANVLNLTTSSGSNGDIVLDADGLGSIIAQDYLSAPGATISATYAGGTSLVLRGGPSGTANIQEWQNSSGTALSVIDENGNLGIGTTNPAYALDVNGDIRLALASDLYFGTIGLNDVGTSDITSGASRIGVYDEFDYSDSTTVQDVLDDLDAQLSGITSLQYYDRVVDPGGEGTDTTIASAINNASANDVIFITEGTYNENITIDKSLTLIGAGPKAVTIAGSAGSDTIAIADGINNVIITRLTASNVGTASSDNVIDSAGNLAQTGIIVYDVVLSGGYHGVYLRSAADSVIARSQVSSAANDGIRIYSSVDNTIAENKVLNAGDTGILVDVNSFRAIVHGNSVDTSTDEGIYLWAATHAAVTNNIIDSSGSDGIVNFQGDFATLTGNVVSDAGDEGIVNSTANFVSLSGNTIDNTTSHGLTISSSTYTSISGNAIDSAGGNGINAISQLNNNITITNNTIDSSAGYGIDANGTVDPTDFVISNNIIKNSGTGSYDAPAAGSNFVFSDNLTDGDTDISQIEYFPSTGNTFSHDLIQMTLDGADSNSFTGNGLHFVVDQSQFSGYLILGEDDGGSDFFRLSDDGTLYTGGSIGIGSTSPNAALDVVGDVYVSSGLSTYGTAVSDGTIEATQFCTGDGETNCVTDFSALSGSANIWTDAGTHIYPTSGEILGSFIPGSTNKLFGLYLNDSSNLSFGTDNDIYAAFASGVLNFTTGSNDINFDANTLVIDGSANNVGIGTTDPGEKLSVNGNIDAEGDIFFGSGVSAYGTAVSDGTVEATKFCTGDGETNCVTDFSSLGGATTLAALTDTDVSSPAGGQVLVYDGTDSWNNVYLTNDILVSTTGAVTIQPNAVALAFDTTGNYVASINAGNGLASTGATTGENISHTLSVNTGNGIQLTSDAVALGPLTADWNQTGAFDIILNNADSQLQILESTGATYYGTLDVGDLSANATYTLAGASGTIWTSGNDGAGSGLDADLLDGISSASFLRSDTSDNFTSGTLTFNSGTELDTASGSTVDINGDLSVADTSIAFDGATTNFAVTGDFSINTDDLFVEKSTGNVGIGTTDPAYPLDIVANNVGSVTMAMQNTNNAGWTSIRYHNDAGTRTASFGYGNSGASAYANQAYIQTTDASIPVILSPNNLRLLTATGTGEVGIGTTTPVGKLDVQGAVTGKALTILNQTGDQDILTASASGATRFVIANNGSVGIGSTSPQAPLDVTGDVYISSGLSTFGTAVSDGTIEATKFCTGDGETNCVTDFAAISGGANIWTDAGTYIYPTDGETLGNSTSAGSNKLAGAYLADSAPLTFGTDNDISATFSSGDLNFSMGTNDINFDSNTLFIDGSANNVGIGTLTPAASLEVKGASDLLFLTDNTVGSTASPNTFGLTFRGYSNTQRAAIYATDEASNFSRGQLVFYTQENAGSLSEKMRINSSGSVGIGSTSPQAPLDVVGDVYISSGLSTYGTAVSDGTIEATKFCTGDGETNCVSDFSSLTSSLSLDAAYDNDSGERTIAVDNGNVVWDLSSSYDFVIGNTSSLQQFILENGQGTPDTANFYVENSGTGGAAHLYMSASDGNVVVNDNFQVLIDTILGDSSSDNIALNGQINSSIIPDTTEVFNLGSDSLRWNDLYLGGDTLHIGTSITDEGTISYNSTSNIFNFGTDSTTNGDIAFFTDDLYLDKSTGFIGVGTTNPTRPLTVQKNGSSHQTAFALQNLSTAATGNGSVMSFDLLNSSAATTTYSTIRAVAQTTTASSETGDLRFDVLAGGTLTEAARLTGQSDGSTRLGLGTSSPTRTLDIVGGSANTTVLRGTDVTTNATTKHFRITSRPYTNTEEDTALLYANNLPTESHINYGGGSSIYNAITHHKWYTAADTTTTTGTHSMTLTNTGLGIGSTSPSTALDVVGDVYISSGLSTFSTAVSDGTIEATKFCTGDSETNCVTDFSSLGGSSVWTDAGTYIYPTSGEALGNSTSAGSNKLNGVYLADSAPLVFGTDNDISATFSGSTLAVSQANNDINFDANTLFIDGSANRIGIGTTSPSSTLEINGVNDRNTTFRRDSTGYQYAINFDDNDFNIEDITGGGYRFTIENTGNVGIGTTNPDHKLEVAGNVKLSTSSFFIYDDIGYFGSGTSISGGTFSQVGIRSHSDLLFATGGSTEVMRISSSGNVGIGTTNPSRILHVRTTADAPPVRFQDTNGYCEINPTSTTWTCTSDARLKNSVDSLPLDIQLDKLLDLRAVSFKWNTQTNGAKQVGFIAQEVEQVFPDLVKTDPETGLKSVSYGAFTPIIIAGLQEQNQQLSVVTTTTNNLRNSIKDVSFTNAGQVQLVDNNNGTYSATQVSNGRVITSVSAFADSVIANLQAGTANIRKLTTGSIQSDSLSSPYISSQFIETEQLRATTVTTTALTSNTATISGELAATSARVNSLSTQIARFNELVAETAVLGSATVSGTLYANNINDFDGLVATAVSNPSVLDTILGNVPTASDAASLSDVYDAIAAAGFSASPSAQFAQEMANLNVDVNSETVLAKQAGYFQSYFEVNGNAQFNSDVAITSSLIVGDSVVIGDGLTLGSGVLSYAPAGEPFPEFAIQPEGKGALSIFAGLMTLDESGIVAITGDLSVAGNVTVANTLFSDLLAPTDFGNPFQVQVAGAATGSSEIKKSRFEIINELGTPVATISAEGSADFAGEVRAQTLSAETVSAQNYEGQTVTTTSTSGRITLPAGETEITIENDNFTENSIISITPIGSTQNQVVYIKEQSGPNEDTGEPGKVVVGIDQAIDAEIKFNWWISN